MVLWLKKTQHNDFSDWNNKRTAVSHVRVFRKCFQCCEHQTHNYIHLLCLGNGAKMSLRRMDLNLENGHELSFYFCWDCYNLALFPLCDFKKLLHVAINILYDTIPHVVTLKVQKKLIGCKKNGEKKRLSLMTFADLFFLRIKLDLKILQCSFFYVIRIRICAWFCCWISYKLKSVVETFCHI